MDVEQVDDAAPAATPADSPIPSDASGADAALSALDDAGLKTWRETGKLPDREPAEPQAEADTPAAGDPEPEPAAWSPDVAPFIKTPPPPGVSKRQHERNELIRAATEAAQRAAALEARLNQPAQPTAPPTPPQPAQKAQEWDGTDPNDPAPALDDFADQPDPYAAHLRASMRWEDRRDARVAQVKEQQAQQQATIQRQTLGWLQRAAAFEATTPEFTTTTAPLVQWLDGPGAANAYGMKQALMESPIGPQLTLHLAAHPDEVNRIARLDPIAQAREIGRLEVQHETPASAAPAPAVPIKHVSTAPAPPTTLGVRPAEPADEVASALKRRDFAAYQRAANARELAALKR